MHSLSARARAAHAPQGRRCPYRPAHSEHDHAPRHRNGSLGSVLFGDRRVDVGHEGFVVNRPVSEDEVVVPEAATRPVLMSVLDG
jgi:hypothetical protein